MKDGNGHVRQNLPLVLAGGGGRLTTGQHVVTSKGTPLGNLHLALLGLFGIKADSFNGVSTGAMKEIFT